MFQSYKITILKPGHLQKNVAGQENVLLGMGKALDT